MNNTVLLSVQIAGMAPATLAMFIYAATDQEYAYSSI
jgi:methylmalonyl-CoA mutase N-terminal domain/subunit